MTGDRRPVRQFRAEPAGTPREVHPRQHHGRARLQRRACLGDRKRDRLPSGVSIPRTGSCSAVLRDDGRVRMRGRYTDDAAFAVASLQ